MRFLYITLLSLSATPIYAHAGHWADFAGHNHWVAGAAIGAAIIAGLYGALSGRGAESSVENDDSTSDE